MKVLVTGSSRGIGKSIIEEFASKGYDVIINYNHSKIEAYKLKEEVESKYKVKAYVYKCDVSKENEVKELFIKIKNEIGKIDVLVNNAGIAIDNDLESKDAKEFMQVIEVNLLGTYLCSKYAALVMEKGTIINISSTDAVDTYNELSIDYCASKAGVNSLTKTMALVLKNIKFIGIMLPWVNTESVKEMEPKYLASELKRTNQKRILEPTEVAQKIFEISIDDKLTSGSILRMEVI